MAIEGLRIIGESINDSVPSTKKLFEANDIEALKALARSQDEGGAHWIDVNVGLRSKEFMADMVRQVQAVTAKPLSIDTPDIELSRAGLEAYDIERAGGVKPIVNSIAETRLNMFELYAVQPFHALFLLSERLEGSDSKQNRTADEAYETAKRLLDAAHKHGLTNDDCIFDPGIAPIGSDTDGINRMVVGTMERIHADADFAGVHMSVGLSNYTVMIPPKKPDGSPVKSPLESAFLTLAMPLGLDTIIGNVKRKYALLPPEDPALVCVREVLALEGIEAVMRVTEYYSG